MNLNSIQQNISNLITETATFETESFKEKLYCACRTKLLGDLKDCKSAEKFKEVLANNWILVKGNALCYTARPDDALTALLCDIAEDISEELNISPIHLLMPKITIESMFGKEDSTYQDYPDLNELPLRKVLKSHILSDSGNYLIPARVLLELPDPLDNNPNRLGNYYYDMGDETAEGYVTEKEFNRLRRHSTHTQALVKAQEDYKTLSKDAGLLSQLQDLIRGLRFNSTSGIGSEMAAGQGAYWALAQFNEYYQQLGEAVKDIPLPVKTAIERLITISSDAAENLTATTNTETCANTRQQELSRLLIKHEAVLANIGLDSNHKAKLLSAARKCFEENKEALRKLLINNELSYSGQDKLGLSHSLLAAFDVKPEITSTATLQDFLSLSPDEIKSIIAKEPSVQTGILQQFPNLEALVLFCLTTPLEPLEALISVMGKSLSDKLITNPNHISACLMLMEGPRLERMMQLLAERLPTLITSAYDFSDVLEDLSLEQRSAVYEALKGQLPTFIKSGGNLARVLLYLNPEQCSAVCDALKARLPTLIKSGVDFGNVLQFLSSEQCSIVYETFKGQLPTLIQSGADFGVALRYLSPEQRNAVYEALKTQLPTLIKNCYDFKIVLENLNPEQRSAVYEALKTQLPTLIKDGDDFRQVLQNLSPEQRSAVYEALKTQLPTFIKSSYDFALALENLSLEQRSAAYEALKTQLPTLIKSGYDFGCVLLYLSPEQCIEVFHLLKADLIKKIEQGVALDNLPNWLASEKCLKALGCSANEKQALQAEIRALLESAKEKRDKTFCPGFESRKRSLSQMQETDENNEHNMLLDESSSDKDMRLQ